MSKYEKIASTKSEYARRAAQRSRYYAEMRSEAGHRRDCDIFEGGGCDRDCLDN